MKSVSSLKMSIYTYKTPIGNHKCERILSKMKKQNKTKHPLPVFLCIPVLSQILYQGV